MSDAMPNGQTYTEVVVQLLRDVDVLKSSNEQTHVTLEKIERKLDTLCDTVADKHGGHEKRIGDLEKDSEDSDKRLNRMWAMIWAQIAALLGVAWAAIRALVVP